ncbi:GON-4-like protein isoform X2 [Antennarius striatus]|uniref:GON-4-like protein isoform X2 n=1 Tax=Antennarius striatus TaxID=241820 RepID=UPI0035B0E39C
MNSVRKRLKLSTTGSTTAPHPLPHHEDEDEGYLLVEEDTTDSSLIITMEDVQKEVKVMRRRKGRKRTLNEEVEGGASESEEEEPVVDLEIDRQLDQSLETKSKQHNLTTVNVRNIIHEVITNEHVVAMMKAAINETEAVPVFEPKMTRAKFKEVVEKGVVIPAWNISPIKKTSDANKAPQFMDILLAEEDSSDEEYRPDEEDEDETAEDTFLESDMESIASSPRGSRLIRGEDDSCSPWQTRKHRRRFRKCSESMGPPPPPKAPPAKATTESSFLEKLHAVEEELAVCMKPYQPLSDSEDAVGLMATRTRSKRPLRDVPLGILEAELRAPDITPDMYDSGSAHEDRDWTDWLRGLMTSEMDNEEECDDEDDPEYNFLADIDEPDLEDYRDDKAVRITKKEVNELMEELFETLKEDLAGQEVDDEGHEEEEEPPSARRHTPEEQRDARMGGAEAEEGPITELRTVKQQLAFIRRRRRLGLQTRSFSEMEPNSLKLDRRQRRRLQQQVQQHVQLLTQIHLLSSPVNRLHSEAETTRQFLLELDLLAQRDELLMSSDHPGFCSAFRASNLQGALQLLEELQETPVSHQQQPRPPDARGYMRCHPVLPAELAWLFATRAVFLYPELLPCASLDPALYCPRRTSAFTAAEDCLLVLGLRNMEGAADPTRLVSQFLLRKTLVQVRRRILQCCRPGFPDNVVKAFRYQRVLLPMLVACRHVDPAGRRPPVEREEHVMPLWLLRSLPVIYPTIRAYNDPSGSAPEALPPRQSRSASYSFPQGTVYPPRLPKHLDFRRIGFVLQHQEPRLPPADSSPLPSGDQQLDSSSSLPPPTPHSPQVVLLSRNDGSAHVNTTLSIRRHYRTLTGLRRGGRLSPPPASRGPAFSPAGSASSQLDADGEEEEEEEEGDVRLALSESSTGSDDELDDEEGAESRRKREETASKEESIEEESTESVVQSQNGAPEEEQEGEQEGEQEVEQEGEQEGEQEVESDHQLFAQDYLRRVCEAVQASPGVSEQLLQVLDQFSAAGPSGAPEALYHRLRGLLQPWPQLLRDFAAFLTRPQARRCGLLLEHQLFERSRRFLRLLRRSPGEGSALYHQVVSVLQGSSTPTPEDMKKISSLLQHHPSLQEEFWEFFQQLHTPGSDNTATDYMSQNPPDRKSADPTSEEESERHVGAKNISTTSNGEKVVVWTREADRAILTACQQRGANQKTFRQVSAQLGNKTAHQVSVRFDDLMTLFHSAFQKSTSWQDEPIRKKL